MLIVTNPNDQVVQPGQAVVLPLIVEKSRKRCAGMRPSNTSVKLSRGAHRVDFGANIGGAAATQPNLALALGGEVLPYTTMTVTTAADTDRFRVSVSLPIDTCCCDFDRISVINTGTTPVTVAAYPMLAIDKCCER